MDPAKDNNPNGSPGQKKPYTVCLYGYVVVCLFLSAFFYCDVVVVILVIDVVVDIVDTDIWLLLVLMIMMITIMLLTSLPIVAVLVVGISHRSEISL